MKCQLELKILLELIEKKRSELNEMITPYTFGNDKLIEKELLQKSIELDELINQYYEE